MAKIWRNRLIAGTQVFSECPEQYRNDVIDLLKQEVAEGNIDAAKFEEITGMGILK